MVILGLDPGLAATGYGVVAARRGALVGCAHGVIRTMPNTEPAIRLAAIAAGVAELLAEHTPDAVVVEEAFVGPNPRTALAVGQARGAALAACGARGVPVAEYPVAVIKTAVCGYGRADKRQVAVMVRAILALDRPPSPEHAADALAAAICHAHRHPIARQVPA